jgi:hypothetical protein
MKPISPDVTANSISEKASRAKPVNSAVRRYQRQIQGNVGDK